MTPAAFAETFGYPPALVRLAIDCGLKCPGGRITGLSFCRWFTAHYNDIRECAGLPLLEMPTKGLTANERRQITICNVLMTLADYSASRTSSLEYREEWTRVSEEVASLCAMEMPRPVMS